MKAAPRRHVIVGTAGHIDHGKTALVKALTGIDADRLEEEKRRGITIDLGFAHLELGDDVTIGFVDVPGHERFVKNMLAGVGGIDLVLLAVAADESIKPQTREHFDICRLLGIPAGIVALTKADLVDGDVLELARLEAEELVKGSFLEGAPVVAVSSVTGEGLDELKRRLAEVAAAVPAKNAEGFLRLPVDRSFSMRGHGTVVTGTLISGAVEKDQEVEVHPGGLRLRVRSVEVHGTLRERSVAGQRTALNVAGVEPSELRRGMVLSQPGLFRATSQADCRLQLLPSAKRLKSRAPVHFHAGTAEIEAEVRLLDGLETLEPGGRAYARLLLREPTLLLPGDRFIVRMFSPVVTIGGGTVLDNGAHHYRRGESAAARLDILAQGSLEERAALLVRESPYGIGIAELTARLGTVVPRGGKYLQLEQPQLVDRVWFEGMTSRLTDVLRLFHQAKPLLPGMPKEDLRNRELPDSPGFLLDALLARSPGVVLEGDLVRLSSHKITLRQDEEVALAAMERLFLHAGLKAPSVAEVLSKSGVEPARARSLFQMLLRDKRLVRVAEDLAVHASVIPALREMLAGRKGQRFSVPDFKEWTGVSRKYAIPLLEFLDRERLTRREGDQRVVL
ncbi:MAG TPA: selenocysteine-specific translation elongation factor [Bryobacteraceae bacterium]|nr:selenocysteine-specific translation elongation factor [Bryobacteraceae bacterium]